MQTTGLLEIFSQSLGLVQNSVAYAPSDSFRAPASERIFQISRYASPELHVSPLTASKQALTAYRICSSYIAVATYLLAACGRSFALCPQPFALPHDS